MSDEKSRPFKLSSVTCSELITYDFCPVPVSTNGMSSLTVTDSVCFPDLQAQVPQIHDLVDVQLQVLLLDSFETLHLGLNRVDAREQGAQLKRAIPVGDRLSYNDVLGFTQRGQLDVRNHGALLIGYRPLNNAALSKCRQSDECERGYKKDRDRERLSVTLLGLLFC
jgi:hypothetical protein